MEILSILIILCNLEWNLRKQDEKTFYYFIAAITHLRL